MAGLTRSETTGERSRRVDAHVATYTSSRLIALTSARSAYLPGHRKNQRHARRHQNRVHRRPELRMDPPEEARQIALLGERKEIARSRQRLPHVVAGRREHGAQREQRRAGATHEEHRGVGERRPRRREARQRAERDDLHQRHQDRDDDDRHDQRKWHRASGIARFARRNGHDFVSAERENQEQPRRRQLRERWRLVRYQQRRSMKKMPTATNAMSGSSFPTVSTFRTRLLCLIPLMLMPGNRDDDRRDEDGAHPARRERRHVESECRGQAR